MGQSMSYLLSGNIAVRMEIMATVVDETGYHFPVTVVHSGLGIEPAPLCASVSSAAVEKFRTQAAAMITKRARTVDGNLILGVDDTIPEEYHGALRDKFGRLWVEMDRDGQAPGEPWFALVGEESVETSPWGDLEFPVSVAPANWATKEKR